MGILKNVYATDGGGYSAYFVELDKELQDEIIRRMAYTEV